MLCRQVSACVKTFNSEKTIADCLSSLASLVDEIIIFDSGSHDRTVAIAKEYGARIIVAENGKAFGNDEICSLLTTDWYFLMEPDAVLNDSSSKQIAPLIKAQPKAANEVAMQIEVTRIDQSETPKPMTLKFIRAPKSKTVNS
jgi:glycosyltransferase involved in cell wall biosynthesis